MYIEIKVITKAHKNIVQKKDDGVYIVRTTTSPQKGKANKSVVKLLADYFDVSKSDIKIIRGQTSKNKIIEIVK